MKMHLALNTHHFDRSVAFYRAFFGAEPVKHKPGYAKFDVEEPPLNLTLNHTDRKVVSGALNHLGVQVADTETVLQATRRLQEEGLATFEEHDTDCCYALQDKVWVQDPDGNRWEVFVVKVGDTRPDLQAALQADSVMAGAAKSCGTGADGAQACGCAG